MKDMNKIVKYLESQNLIIQHMRIIFFKNEERKYSKVMRLIVEDYVRDVKSYLYGAKVLIKSNQREGRIVSVLPGLSTTDMVYFVEFELNETTVPYTLKGIKFL